MKTRSHPAVRSIAASAVAVLSFAFAGAVAAQADNSNAIVESAPSGGAVTYFDATPSYYHGPRYGNDYSRQSYADERARQRAADAERADPSSPTTLGDNPANVDPVTGAITAPGYMGPKDVSK